ncbi:MAG TPA: DUF2937 family protein [Nevskiaceae bacterium]|nr:DUF2937 family protein [Nevskiaceae bacterium]
MVVRFIGGLAERVAAVALALTLAQFPVYYDAYLNTVAGARAEAEARLHELEREAAGVQMSVEAFIAHHEASADPAFAASGRMHRTTLEHYRHYSGLEHAMSAAPVWQKPLVLAQNFEPALHQATHFTPAVPLTPEALIYAALGLLLAWLTASLLARPFRRRTTQTGS